MCEPFSKYDNMTEFDNVENLDWLPGPTEIEINVAETEKAAMWKCIFMTFILDYNCWDFKRIFICLFQTNMGAAILASSPLKLSNCQMKQPF